MKTYWPRRSRGQTFSENYLLKTSWRWWNQDRHTSQTGRFTTSLQWSLGFRGVLSNGPSPLLPSSTRPLDRGTHHTLWSSSNDRFYGLVRRQSLDRTDLDWFFLLPTFLLALSRWKGGRREGEIVGIKIKETWPCFLRVASCYHSETLSWKEVEFLENQIPSFQWKDPPKWLYNVWEPEP